MFHLRRTPLLFRVLALGLLILAAPSLHAVQAPQKEYVFTQPDGTTFKARIRGDEWFHWHETPSGHPIVRDEKTKKWHYAEQAEEGIGPAAPEEVGKHQPKRQPWTPNTPVKAMWEQKRKRERTVPLRTGKPGVGPKSNSPAAKPDAGGKKTRTSGASGISTQSGAQSSSIETADNVGTTAAALNITQGKIALFLTTFSDREGSQVTAPDFYEKLLFDTTPGVRSMSNYYKDVSKGQFSVTSGPSGISGWWLAPKTHDYYGANTSAGKDANAPELVLSTVTGADATFDFGPYDTDNDGFVDLVAIVHQGTAEAFGGTPSDIWPHQWTLTNAGKQAYETNDVNANGVRVKINSYFITSEINDPTSGATATMGVFAHEYGHALGLPDLYDTDRTASAGLGSWCLMAGGSNNSVSQTGDCPAFMSAWCRWELGWIEPERLTYNQRQRKLPDVKDKDEVLFLWKDGVQGNQYFLVENRQKLGWDLPLPAGGLLIFHCDDSVTTNNNKQWWWNGSAGATGLEHYIVALEQADGEFNLERTKSGFANSGDIGDPYVQGREFDTYTTPSSRRYNTTATLGDNGVPTNVAVKNISPAGATMTADFFINEDRSFPEVTITDPQPNTLYNVVTTIGGFASAPDLKHVKVALQENRPGGRWWSWGQNAWGSTTFSEAAHAKIASGTGSWSVSVPALSDGAYFAFAKAVDNNNAASEWVSVNFTVQADTSAPSITIISPEQDATLATAPTLSGTAQDNTAIREKRIALWSSQEGKWYRWASGTFADTDFSFETSVYKITSGDTEWSLALPSNLAQGRYEAHVQAVDTTDQGSAWVSRAFSLAYKPLVTITTPSAGLFSNAFPEIRGTAQDKSGTGLENGSVLLTIYRDGQFWNGTAWQTEQTTIAVAVQSDGTWSYPANATATGAIMPTGSGYYAINVAARDNAGNWSQPVAPGNTGTNQITIDIDSDPPHVQIAGPSAGTTLRERILNDDWFFGTASDSRGSPEVSLYIKRVSDGMWWTGTGWHFSRDAGRSAAVYNTQASTSGSGSPISQNQWKHPGRMPHIGLHADCLRSGEYEFIALARDRAGNEREVTTLITVDYTVPLPNDPLVRAHTPAITAETVSAAGFGTTPRAEDDDQYQSVRHIGRDAAGNVYSLVQRYTRANYQFGATFPSVWVVKHNAAGELQWKLERQQSKVTVQSEGLESSTYYEKFSDQHAERQISAIEFASYYTAGDMKVDPAGNLYVALNVSTLQYVQYAISAGGSPLFHYAPVPVALTVIYKFNAEGGVVWRRTVSAGDSNSWFQRNHVVHLEPLSTGDAALLINNSTYVSGSQWSPSYVMSQTVAAVVGESAAWVAKRGYGEYQSTPLHFGVDAQDNLYLMSDEDVPSEGRRKALRKFTAAGEQTRELHLELCDLPEEWRGFAIERATGELYFGGEFLFPGEVSSRQIVTKVDLSREGNGEEVIAWRAYAPMASGYGYGYGPVALRLTPGGITVGSSATDSQNLSDQNYWSLSRFSRTGNLLWNRTYESDVIFSNNYGASLNAFDVDAADNIYLTGSVPNDQYGYDAVFAKFSAQGDLQFIRQFPTGTYAANEAQFLFEPNATNPSHVLVSAIHSSTDGRDNVGFVRFSNHANTTLPITFTEGTPADRSAAIGEAVTFSATTEGGTPWTYQWRKHDASGTPQPITGATGPTLTLTNVQLTNAGNYSLLATNGSGAVASRTATLTVYQTIPLPEALDSTLTWTTGGDKPWHGRSGAGRNGDDGAVSGAIGNNQESTIETVFTGPGLVSFDWKTSCEYSWDFLAVFVDGEETARISGDSDWQRGSVDIPEGSHTVRWAYRKDGSGVSGADAGYLDAVVFTADADLVAPTITQQPQSQGVQSFRTAILSVAASGSEPMRFQWYRNGVLMEWQTASDLYIDGNSPEAAGSYHCVVTNRKGSATSSTAVVTISNDSEAPQVAVTSPAKDLSVTTPTLLVSGTASDNEGVAEVSIYVMRPDGSAGTVIATGTTTWQATVPLTAGENFLYVQALDTAGNYSSNVFRKVTYQAATTLTVATSGQGSVMEVVGKRAVPAPATSERVSGERYTFQAKPAAGYLFAGWRDGQAIVSTSPKLILTMGASMELTAVFIQNRWAELSGTYSGLIHGDVAAPGSTGHLTVTVTSSRAVTGKVSIGSLSFPLKGKVEPDGQGNIQILKRGLPPVEIQLNFDAANGGSTVLGQVSLGGQPLASFTAERSGFHKKKNPAPMAGTYTVLLPGADEVHGYATMTVTTGGLVQLSGAMPDGRFWSHGTTVSASGRFPLFAALSEGGTAAGYITFADQPEVSDFAGTLTWIRSAADTPEELPVIGSAYTLQAGQGLLPGIDSLGAALILEGGELDAQEPLSIKVGTPSKKGKVKVTLPSPNAQTLKVKVTGKTGLFTGSLIPTGGAEPIPFRGVLFQKQQLGAGWFLNGTTIGSLLLEPATAPEVAGQ